MIFWSNLQTQCLYGPTWAPLKSNASSSPIGVSLSWQSVLSTANKRVVGLWFILKMNKLDQSADVPFIIICCIMIPRPDHYWLNFRLELENLSVLLSRQQHKGSRSCSCIHPHSSATMKMLQAASNLNRFTAGFQGPTCWSRWLKMCECLWLLPDDFADSSLQWQFH